MKLASRVLLVLAAVALVAGLVLGALPVKVDPASASPTPGAGKVSCGTAFSQTEWSSDDACEGPLLSRLGVSLAAFGLCVVFFLLGAGALVLGMSRHR